MPADAVGVAGPEHRPRSERQLVSSPVPDPPMISAEAAARALCELFLANADRGDNAANDHLIAEMVGRIRAQQEQLVEAAPTMPAQPPQAARDQLTEHLDAVQ